MTDDMLSMSERLAEREELDRLRAENARLRRELEEERNPLLRMARYHSARALPEEAFNHPEVLAYQSRAAQNAIIGIGAGVYMGLGLRDLARPI